MKLPPLLLLLLCAVTAVRAVEIGQPFELSREHPAGSVVGGIRLLGALKLGTATTDGRAAVELSGLAWDEDEGVLYAVSDEGYLVHLKPRFDQDHYLAGVELLSTHPLQGPAGRPLAKGQRDAEGLAIRQGDNGVAGDTLLAVSYEVEPRIWLHRPDGRFLEALELPPPLADAKHYRGRNAALESLTWSPLLGWLTAPQKPLKGTPAREFRLYGLAGDSWSYPPLDPEHSDQVGMAGLGDDRVLLLERVYRSFFQPVVFALRRLHPAPGGGAAAVREVFRFNSSEGWRVDNFEGLAHHHGRRYFMVSDDNQSAIQKTLLVYFELLEEGP
ncbi:MAG: esterase-like activity of phytase family protein [Gammaproteobacteria bacterium]|nr:MAG: esterase-like activity of phytase family protein [Gammaproteobacteria bacterium]